MGSPLVGTWVLDSAKSESVDDLLSAQGVGFIKRKAITNLSVTCTITVSDKKVKVKNETSLRTRENEFDLGGDWVDVEEELTELPAKRKAHLEGDKFVVISKNDNGELTVTREVEGTVLKSVITLVKPDGGVIKATRYFNKA